MIAQTPELFDGGYWYVMPIVIQDGGRTPGDIEGVGWCAWYGIDYVAVRMPEPVDGIADVGISVHDVLPEAAGYTGKPYGRIGGR